METPPPSVKKKKKDQFRHSDETKWGIVNFKKHTNWTNIEIAKTLCVTVREISRIYKRYKEYGDVKNRAGGKRQLSINDEASELLKKELETRPSLTGPQLVAILREQKGINCARSTVLRHLKKIGLKNRVAAKRPYLTDRNRQNRLKFALDFVLRPMDFWKTVVFSDECSVQLGHQTDMKVWRRDGERYASRNLNTERVTRARVTIWGAISFYSKSSLEVVPTSGLTASFYESLLENVALPFCKGCGPPDHIYQQDNVPAHSTDHVYDIIKESGIRTMDWPAFSPDLNPIEHVWAYMKRRYRSKYPDVVKEDEAVCYLIKEWDLVPQYFIQSLYYSMARRLREVLKHNGGSTKY